MNPKHYRPISIENKISWVFLFDLTLSLSLIYTRTLIFFTDKTIIVDLFVTTIQNSIINSILKYIYAEK